jgi:hypothetical protein
VPQACWEVKIAKVDELRRLVSAIYSEVSKADGSPVIDLQGDIIPIDELEAADIEAFADGGLRKGGEMHAKIGGADVVQHFTLSRQERQAFGFGPGPELGIVKLRVNDDRLWARVLAGELPGLSIAGSAESEEVA